MAERFLDMSETNDELASARLKGIRIKSVLRRSNETDGALRAQVREQDARIAELEARLSALEERTGHDSLTGVLSRDAFLHALQGEWNRHARARQTLGFIYFDVDNFKAYNDTFDHLIGDQVLRGIGQQSMRCVRRSGEIVGRIGGDEFAVLVPNATLKDTATVAVRIRKAIAAMQMKCGEEELHVGTSHGVAIANPYEDGNTEVLIKRADDALHYAKDNGKNRVIAFREYVDGQNVFAAVNEEPQQQPVALKRR
jgi:diguanylate cyclase (GGDEF)-like protein